jgi:hypothetical protein
MGSDMLVLSVLGTAIIWYNPGVLRSHSLKALVPLAICSALLAVFALSSKMTLGGKPILTLGHFYGPLIEIISPVRTSGRFIWPLHYLYVSAIIAIWIVYY